MGQIPRNLDTYNFSDGRSITPELTLDAFGEPAIVATIIEPGKAPHTKVFASQEAYEAFVVQFGSQRI